LGGEVTHTWMLHDKPWRHYTCDGERETPNGLKIASVTQVLGVLDKSGPLVGWATNLTTEAVWLMATKPKGKWTAKLIEALHAEAEVKFELGEPRIGHAILRRAQRIKDEGYTFPVKWETLRRDLQRAALDHRSVTNEAAFRGTSIHKLHEDYVNDGRIPNPGDHPTHWHGYVMAYAKWLMWMQARGAEFTASEAIVGSAIHGFAGTCDTVAIVRTKDGRRERWDFKSSKQVYARTHFRQLGAYELADVEMGGEPCDRLGIAVLREDGKFVVSHADEIEWRTSPQQSFLDVLTVFRDEGPLKQHEDQQYKARKAAMAASKEEK